MSIFTLFQFQEFRMKCVVMIRSFLIENQVFSLFLRSFGAVDATRKGDFSDGFQDVSKASTGRPLDHIIFMELNCHLGDSL